jgi:uncharacterized membrane protein
MTKQILVQFYIILFGLTILMAGSVNMLPQNFPTKDMISVLVFFMILTALIYPIAAFGRKSNDGYTFIAAAYISIGLRFILSLCFVVYYKYTRSTYEVSFILFFFIAYILYTLFEIYWLTAKLRPDLKDKTTSNDAINK